MLPLRDVNPTRNFPIMTIILIAVNVLVFIYELILGPQLEGFVQSWAIIPYEITHGVDLPPASIQPIYLTLITAMFLHGGFVHIAGNMLFLWIFGNNIEDAMGSLRFLVFYLLCGLAAAFAQIAVGPNSDIPNIGASGAIAGVLGAYLLLFPRAEVQTLVFLGFFVRLVRLPALLFLGLWFVLQLFSGVAGLGMEATGGVAWFAHIGGFIAGIVLINLFRRR
jgi:membrane associated rhomboid family serine protease